ncbi:MAG: response regulator [Planctomycetes bacterium]|nr:response regulator [Planctomycetota bacterium]
MTEEVVILIAEDDAGHFALIKKNLWRSCIANEILQFKDGQEVLDFMSGQGGEPVRKPNTKYILLLDIRMPKVDGREVLRRMKEDAQLRKIPVIMLTTTDEEAEVENCYDLGCSFYIVKPADYNKFMEAVGNLGTFLSLQGVSVPAIA